VLILAAIAAGALYLYNLQLQPTTGGGPPVATIPTAPVIAGPLERTLRLSGTTDAVNYVTLRAPQMLGGRGSSLGEVTTVSTGARGSRGGGGPGGGAVAMLGGGGPGLGRTLTITFLAESGTRVHKGDVVIEFDREELLNRLDEFQTRVAQNEANLASVRAQLDALEKDHAQSIREATADLERARLDLKTTAVRSAIDAEHFRLALEEAEIIHKQVQTEVPLMRASLEAQWKLAQLARDEGRAELKRMQLNVDRMVLRAPIDGMVVVMSTVRRGSGDQSVLKAGDEVGPGMPVVKIVDLSSMMVNAKVNQVDAEKIRVGAKARIQFDAFPGLELPGEVYGIAALPKASQFREDWVREVPVLIRLTRTDPRVIPDLSVSADVALDAEPQTLVIPLESVFRDAPDGPPYVFVRQPEGWVRRQVELGAKNYISTSVVSGLKAGEVVATQRPPEKQEKSKQQ